ncbi:MAG TPA: hypothetical protein VE909_10800 [Xanthobacteraceae bacterium]|nr:hypothetical protein [Xanthobacteraceae bacterium]
MPEWLSWPADLLLGAGAVIAGWFVDQNEPSFIVIQMMVATLVLAGIVALIVYWSSLAEFWRSLRKSAGTKRP